ncbi:putative iron-regulated protein [Hyphomicrobiales bacterium]|nr:putative iron-regulated protein [Hyphomicrobiales bacterium]CAH1701058.1 Putative iron-regulated protein [Hyphomicrobiales bacterium]CAI0344117.1 putative iron-regulated protein [Hyphomicrobiales bacterium]
MLAAAEPGSTGERIAHPRASWLCPDTGRLLPQGEVMRAVAKKRVVLLGETHDVAEIHRWQLHVTAFLHMLRPQMAVGFEMFPLRVQHVLDAWVAGAMDTATLIERSEWAQVWGFDPELYLPLFHFCRQQRVRMLALNCHRPLVTRVGQVGWEAIPVEERDGVTPSAPATDAYRAYLERLMGSFGRAERQAGAASPISDRFLRAQQTWDRSFACRIAGHLASAPGDLVIGIIGRGHLEYGHGTPYQLRDLGIGEVAVLLPGTAGAYDAAALAGIAEAVFRLDTPEPPLSRRELPKPA